MQIRSLSSEPILKIPFLNAGSGAGSFYVDSLPVQIAIVDGLPDQLDCIVATADLQGRECFEDSAGGPLQLLGQVLPKRLSEEILPNLGLKAARSGVILAGDFYTVPALDRRGGSGDVTEVWRAFGQEFLWCVGVAGNHDTFGDHLHPAHPLGKNLHYLNGDRTNLAGLAIAGIGGIVGNYHKPHRRSGDDFAHCVGNLLGKPTDILVMHDGPNVPASRLRGSPVIREALELHQPALVVRGHAHWEQPLAQLNNGTQVLNVDCRVVIMCANQSINSPAGRALTA